MVNARFVNDTTPVEVHGENEQTTVNVTSQSETRRVGVNSTARHDTLTNRDLPDQHPISAITGLQDVIDRLWTFTYEQGVASDTWTIEHNLGRKPTVVVVDSADNVFYPAVQYIDLNTVVVTMNGATTGKAYLN